MPRAVCRQEICEGESQSTRGEMLGAFFAVVLRMPSNLFCWSCRRQFSHWMKMFHCRLRCCRCYVWKATVRFHLLLLQLSYLPSTKVEEWPFELGCWGTSNGLGQRGWMSDLVCARFFCSFSPSFFRRLATRRESTEPQTPKIPSSSLQTISDDIRQMHVVPSYRAIQMRPAAIMSKYDGLDCRSCFRGGARRGSFRQQIQTMKRHSENNDETAGL